MYDAIVVGARCAGSPTAMLLARTGLPRAAGGPGRLPERHALDPLHPPARRRAASSAGACWTRSSASGCPPIRRYTLDVGPFALAGRAAAASTASPTPTRRAATCSTRSSSRPRRDAGAEVREHFTVAGAR